jgi:predicted nucleic acid-binding protein
MTVVSNTSPINYLTLIGLDRLLPALFWRVIIPLAVQEELKSLGAPPPIGEMLRRSVGRLDVLSVSGHQKA